MNVLQVKQLSTKDVIPKDRLNEEDNNEIKIILKKYEEWGTEKIGLHTGVAELVLVHCNIVNNDCQNDSRILYTFISNRLSSQLLGTSPKDFIF